MSQLASEALRDVASTCVKAIRALDLSKIKAATQGSRKLGQEPILDTAGGDDVSPTGAAAAPASAAPVQPQDGVVVPREPTKEMIEAGISAIMSILRPTKMTREMTIDELEKLINSENPPSLHLESDGSGVTELQPTQSSAREVSQIVYKTMLAARPKGGQ